MRRDCLQTTNEETYCSAVITDSITFAPNRFLSISSQLAALSSHLVVQLKVIADFLLKEQFAAKPF